MFTFLASSNIGSLLHTKEFQRLIFPESGENSLVGAKKFFVFVLKLDRAKIRYKYWISLYVHNLFLLASKTKSLQSTANECFNELSIPPLSPSIPCTFI